MFDLSLILPTCNNFSSSPTLFCIRAAVSVGIPIIPFRMILLLLHPLHVSTESISSFLHNLLSSSYRYLLPVLRPIFRHISSLSPEPTLATILETTETIKVSPFNFSEAWLSEEHPVIIKAN